MTGQHGIHFVAVVLACSLCLGCTSAYMPRPSPQISLVMENGHFTYVRDGKKFEGGLFGGEIEEAVRGNPRAEEYASEFKSGSIAGFALAMLGAGGIAGGFAATTLETDQQQSNHSATALPGLLVLAGGVVAYATGLALLFNAQPHLFDAINAYNDAVAGRTDSASVAPAGQ